MKMTKNYYCFFFVLILASCNNNQNNLDKEREKLLQEKKERIENNLSDTKSKSDTSQLIINFSPYVPAYPSLDEDGISIIENRLTRIISRYGVTKNTSDPSFALIPAVNITSQNITATAPAMFANTYEITFYTANMLDGSIFSSTSFTIKGVGTSPVKAFINAMQSSSFDETKFGKLLKDGQENAFKYYQTNCAEIIAKARNEELQKNYSSAFLMLKSIPTSIDCYGKANTLLQEVLHKKIATDCNQLLTQMKAELGKQSDLGGFNEKAMSYYALITSDAPCYNEAQQVYNGYLKKLDPNAKQKWEQEERDFNLRKDKQEEDHEYAMTKADLEAQVAIDGQTALLNKYKKDYEYDKLPWLRKLVHLGEWDPFDATSRINSK